MNNIIHGIADKIGGTTQTGLSIFPIRLTGSEIVSPTSSNDAAVRMTPNPENINIVSGKPIICPVICARCDLAKRLKSGMLSDKVAQKPTIAVKAAMKYGQNDASAGRFAGTDNTSLIVILGSAQNIKPKATMSNSGAAKVSRCLIDSEPRITTIMFATQKMKKPITSPVPPSAAHVSENAENNKCMAMPPNSVWIPNQP